MAQLSLFRLVGDSVVSSDFRCTDCRLSAGQQLQSNCMRGSGASSPTYMFVGYNPGAEDDSIGRPMTGHNGRIFWELLAEAGFMRDEVYVTNATKCASFGEDVRKSDWTSCRPHLVKEINDRKPEIIVAVGAKTVEWLTGRSGLDRLRRTRLGLSWDQTVPVYSIRQPLALAHVHGEERRAMRASMVQDLAFLKQQVRHQLHKQKWEDVCDYKIAETVEQIDEFLDEVEKQPLIACDLETITRDLDAPSLDHENGLIQSIGFSWKRGVARAIPMYSRGESSYCWWPDGVVEQKILPRLTRIFQNIPVFGQNFVQFDQKWIRRFCNVWRCRTDFDVQSAHYTTSEEGRHDLETIAMELLGVSPWKHEFDPRDTRRLCLYMCKDVDVTWQCREALEKKMGDPQRLLMSLILMPLANELMEMEWVGVHLDSDALNTLQDYLTRRIAEETSKFRSLSEVQAFEFSLGHELNLDSPDQVRVLFRDYLKLPQVSTTGGGEYSTDKEWQEAHKTNPFVSQMVDIRRLNKLKGTYVDGILARAKRGRIFTHFSSTRTTSGRLNSTDPNLQNLPRDDTAGKVLEDANAIKKIFSADEDHALLQGDFSQAELKVLASASGDQNLIGIFLRGEDVHTATAAKVCGKQMADVTKGERSNAKAVNFGIIYGMSKESLIEKFVAAGNSASQAEAFYYGHQKEFPDVWQWMNQQERIIRQSKQQVTPFGRTRRYGSIDEHAIRQAYNFPIQSQASDITEISLIRLASAFRVNRVNAQVLLTVHDSIIVQAHLDHFWTTADLMHNVMSTIHFDWMRVPMSVDLEAGFSWGTLKKLDLKNRTLKE